MINNNVENKEGSEINMLKDVIKDWLNDGFENEADNK
jgi:hypothetical protein